MASGYVNKETRIFADNVNEPHIMDADAINDVVYTNVEEWVFTLDDDTIVTKKVVVYD